MPTSGSVGSRVTNSSKIWLPRLPTFECLSHAASTGQASPPSAASQTLTRSSFSLITSAPITRFWCSKPRRVVGLILPFARRVDDVAVDHPRAQRALALLAADDAREALELLGRVGQPVGVVGVHRPVAPYGRGQVLRPEDAGALGVGVGAPLAVAGRAGAVETREPGHLEEHPTDRGHALLREGVGDVGHDRVVGVQRVAGTVGGRGVHPRHAAGLVLAREQVAYAGGLAHVEEGVDRAQLLAVGVADREEAGGRPVHQRGRVVEHVALVGPVEVLGHRRQRAVDVLHRHLHVALVELLDAVGGQVGGRAAPQDVGSVWYSYGVNR